MLKISGFILIIVTRLFGHFKQVGYHKVRLFFAIALLIPTYSFGQNNGETLFKSYCVACHTIGQGRLVGPDLKDVNDKYDEDWLISFIQSSQTMVALGDEKAIALFNEYMIPMPDQPLDVSQTKELLSYINTQSTPAVQEVKTTAEDLVIVKNEHNDFPSGRSLAFVDIVLLSVMGVETITILVLINLLFVLIKTVRSLK